MSEPEENRERKRRESDSCALTDSDFIRLAELIAARPPVVSCLDTCLYKKDAGHDRSHDVLDRWIANDIKKNARNEKIRATVIAGLILGAAGSLGTGAVTAISYIRDHIK